MNMIQGHNYCYEQQQEQSDESATQHPQQDQEQHQQHDDDGNNNNNNNNNNEPKATLSSNVSLSLAVTPTVAISTAAVVQQSRTVVAAVPHQRNHQSYTTTGSSSSSSTTTGTTSNSSSKPNKSNTDAMDRDSNITDNHNHKNSGRIEQKSIKDYIPYYLKRYIHPASSNSNTDDDDDTDTDTDFCMTTHVKSTKLIAQCMMEGFLPMAYNDHILLPKLHTLRSIVPLRNTIPIITTTQTIYPSHPPTQQQQHHQWLHISKNTRKRSKHYYMTINAAFDTVIEHCQQQHNHNNSETNHCWLYPNLLHIFRTIHNATIQCRDGYTTMIHSQTKQQQPQQQQKQPQEEECVVSIRLFSIEVWNCDTNEFAAGEIGYTVGDTIYTSLTGCCVEDNAGTIQLASLGALLLHLQSFQCWDLGMDMPYKQTLGAQSMTRQNFVSLIHTIRIKKSQPPITSSEITSSSLSSIVWPIQRLVEPINCRDMIDAITTDNDKNSSSNNNKNTNNKNMSNNHNKGGIQQTHDDNEATSVRLNKKQRKALKKMAMGNVTADANIATTDHNNNNENRL